MLFPKLSAQETELRYHLTPGDTYTLEVEIHQNTRSESLYGDEITLFSRMMLDFIVDSVDRLDHIHMRAGYRDLHLSMLAPSMDMDMNSQSMQNRLLTDMLDSLEQYRFSLVMTSSGELRSQKEISPVIRKLPCGPETGSGQHEMILNTLDEVYGTNAFRSLFNLFVSVYPVVQPIRNWTRDLTYYFNTKPVGITNRYHLARTTDRVIIIQGMGMLNSTEASHEQDDQHEVSSTVSGSQTYDFQMDIETGWLKQCVSRQRLVIETTIIKDPYLPKGLKIPSYTETLFEVKGTHSDKSSTCP
ncbi:MAG: DUF6263 family protein [Bacteroidota bacterium]